MLRFFRRKSAPVPVPTRDDLRIRNLLDDPALRRAVGLDPEPDTPDATAPGVEIERSPLLTQLGLDDIARRRAMSPDRHPASLGRHAPCDRRRPEPALDDAAA